MAFVPEGQADSSQARSAWVAMQRDPSRRDGRSHCQSHRYLSAKLSPGMSKRQRVECFLMIPGTSCLATIVLSLRDKSHSPIEAPHNYLSAYLGKPGVT